MTVDDIEGVLRRHGQVVGVVKELALITVIAADLQGPSAPRGGVDLEVRRTISTFAATDDKLLVEGLEEYLDDAGETVKHPCMGIFGFRDGRICSWRDYFKM